MQHPNQDEHARHEALLIAAHASGDLTDVDRTRAEALLSTCDACGELRRDLVALAAATRSVPAPATLARDLRLSTEQADRLRHGSWLRALLRPFGAATSPVRPMAAAFTSLGIVGLLVGVTLTAAPGAPMFSAASGDSAAGGQPAGSQAAAAEVPKSEGAGGNGFEAQRTPGAVPAAGASDRIAVQMATAGPGRDQEDGDPSMAPRPVHGSPAPTQAADGRVVGQGNAGSGSGGAESTITPTAVQVPTLVIAGSLALLGIGLLLFGLRNASRRVR